MLLKDMSKIAKLKNWANNIRQSRPKACIKLFIGKND